MSYLGWPIKKSMALDSEVTPTLSLLGWTGHVAFNSQKPLEQQNRTKEPFSILWKFHYICPANTAEANTAQPWRSSFLLLPFIHELRVRQSHTVSKARFKCRNALKQPGAWSRVWDFHLQLIISAKGDYFSSWMMESGIYSECTWYRNFQSMLCKNNWFFFF